MPFSQLFNQQEMDEDQWPLCGPNDFSLVSSSDFHCDASVVPLCDRYSMYFVQPDTTSPDYSQFINFDTLQDDYIPAHIDKFSSEALSGIPSSISEYTDPDASNARLINDISVPFANDLANRYIPQTVEPESPCLTTINLPEIEDCGPAIWPTIDTGSLANRPQVARTPERKFSLRSNPRVKHEQREGRKQPTAKSDEKSSSSDDQSADTRAKQAHSVIERRYRDNLNGKIMELHKTLLALESTSRLSDSLAHHKFYSRGYRTKFRKSDVMTDAINYVHLSELEMRRMTDEIRGLSARLKTLKGLVKCGDCTLLNQVVKMQLNPQPMR